MNFRQVGIFLLFCSFSFGFFSSRFNFEASNGSRFESKSASIKAKSSLSRQLVFSLNDSQNQSEMIERLNFFATVLLKSPQITGYFYGRIEFLKDKNLHEWLHMEMAKRGVPPNRFQIVRLKNKDLSQKSIRESASLKPNHETSDQLMPSNTLFELAPTNFEAPKFIATEDGICLASVNKDLVETLTSMKPYCRQILTLPALPLEISQETASFLKILSKRKVLLGRYTNSAVLVADRIEAVEMQCDFEEAHNPQSYFDCLKSKSSLPQKYEAGLHVIDYKDALKYVKSGFSIAAWDVFAETPAGRLPIESLLNKASWEEHFRISKSILEKNGFEVVTLDQPYPFLELKKLNFRSPSGHLLRTEINTELHFYSFTNSLILGAQAYVPTFEYNDFKFANHHSLQTKLQNLNQKALQLYETHGLQVEPIVADKLTKETGGILLITHPLSSLSAKFR